jgi:hypothetical protein
VRRGGGVQRLLEVFLVEFELRVQELQLQDQLVLHSAHITRIAGCTLQLAFGRHVHTETDKHSCTCSEAHDDLF